MKRNRWLSTFFDLNSKHHRLYDILNAVTFRPQMISGTALFSGEPEDLGKDFPKVARSNGVFGYHSTSTTCQISANPIGKLQFVRVTKFDCLPNEVWIFSIFPVGLKMRKGYIRIAYPFLEPNSEGMTLFHDRSPLMRTTSAPLFPAPAITAPILSTASRNGTSAKC